MKKIMGALIVLMIASVSAFADWDKSINFGMSFPVFNQKYEMDDDGEDSGDDSKVKGVGVNFDVQGRFVNNSSNIALMGAYSIGYLGVDAEDFFGSDEASGTLKGVTQSIIVGAGYRFAITEQFHLTASALAGITLVNLSTELTFSDRDEDGPYSVKGDVETSAFDFELGADIFAQFYFNEHWGISASCSALFTVYGTGDADIKFKKVMIPGVGSFNVSEKSSTDFDVKPGSFIFVPRIIATYRF